jgi:poly(3-hydroxybutyrate) depolymerase
MNNDSHTLMMEIAGRGGGERWMLIADLIGSHAIRLRERMKSPLQGRKVRLRGLGGPAPCGVSGTCASATGSSDQRKEHKSRLQRHTVRLRGQTGGHSPRRRTSRLSSGEFIRSLAAGVARTIALALGLSACAPSSCATRARPAAPDAPPSAGPARTVDPAPGYRLVAPLAADARARAESALTEIQRLPLAVWQAHTFRGTDGIEIPYRLLPPENPQPGRRYPLVVVFHGSGEIGTDNERHLTRIARAWARPEIRRGYPAYVLAPQMPERSANYTAGPESTTRASVPGRPLFTALQLIDRLRAELPVDSSRVYAIGFSMGASAAMQAIVLRPELFAAAIPVAGVPDRAQVAAVARTPLWIIHGNSDEENPIGPNRAFVPVLVAVPGARVTFWEYDAGEHRVPAELLASDAFPRWLWAHQKP